MMLGLAGAVTLLALGVLIGLGLHGRVVDQKYRRLAHLVRELNDQQDADSRNGYHREICDECSLDQHRLVLGPANGHRVGGPAAVPRPRQYDPRLGHGSASR